MIKCDKIQNSKMQTRWNANVLNSTKFKTDKTNKMQKFENVKPIKSKCNKTQTKIQNLKKCKISKCKICKCKFEEMKIKNKIQMWQNTNVTKMQIRLNTNLKNVKFQIVKPIKYQMW